MRPGENRASVLPILKTAPIDDVLQSLRAIRQRMLAQTFLLTLGRGLLILGAFLVIAAAIRRWLFQLPPWDTTFALISAGIAVGGILIATLAQRKSLPQAAQTIDRLGSTHDRFVTALAFEGEKQPELQQRALQECAAYIAKGNFARLIRLRWPRELNYLIVPAVALGLLIWESRISFAARDLAAAEGQATVEDTIKRLEELARQAEKANEQSKSEDLKRIAEELKRSAEKLRAEAKDAESAEKAELRELSALEQLVQDMQKQPAGPTEEERKELAKALEKNEETKESANSLEKGDLAKAAEQLENAMKELQEAGDERTKEEIEKALQEAVERLAQQKELSEALQKLAQQMKQQQQQGQQGQAQQQMSKELAEMLKKLQPQPGKSNQQNQQNSQDMKNLLAALQNLKFGEGQNQAEGQNQPGGGMVMMESFSKNPSADGSDGNPMLPSGQAGSEKDTGTTENPFGKEGEAGKDGAANSLKGRLADGETMQQFLPSAGDTTKSQRRYKELYEAMAPAAEDAVVQENIPLGSRFLIKRYFESIRPRE